MSDYFPTILLLVALAIGIPSIIFLLTYLLNNFTARGTAVLTRIEDLPSHQTADSSTETSSLSFEAKNWLFYSRSTVVMAILLYTYFFFYYKSGSGTLILTILILLFVISLFKATRFIDQPIITLSTMGITFKKSKTANHIQWNAIDNILFTVWRSGQWIKLRLKSGAELIIDLGIYKNRREFRNQFEHYASTNGVKVIVEDRGI